MQLQHLDLARCQLLELGRRRRAAAGGGCRTNSSITRRVTAGASSASPARDRADPLDELLRRHVLEQEAARAGAKRLVDVLVHVERRQHHDLRLGSPSASSRRVASIPSISGMRTSIRTTSGRRRCTSSTASPRSTPRRRPPFRPRRRGSSGTRRGRAPGRRRSRPGCRRRSSTRRRRPDRRNSLGSSGAIELVEATGRSKSLRRCGPRSTSVKPELVLLVLEERVRRLREQDLAAVAGAADARRAVDGEAVVLGRRRRRPHPCGSPSAPAARRPRARRGETSARCAATPPAPRPWHAGTRRRTRRPACRSPCRPPPRRRRGAAGGDRRGPRHTAREPAQERRRALDVREEKRDGSARRLRHAPEVTRRGRSRLSGDRQTRAQLVAAFGARPGLQLAAVDRRLARACRRARGRRSRRRRRPSRRRSTVSSTAPFP